MPTIKLNDRGPEVRKLQLLLNSLVTPRPNLRVDGHFGQRTHQAVVSFQRAKGLTPDGQVGPKTHAALGLKSISVPVAAPATPSAPWMDIAIAELGVHEDSLPGQHNARIVEYHQTTSLKATDDETPWCSSFVNWVMKQSGRSGTNSAAAKSWLNWGLEVISPTLGVIVVIKKKTPGVTQATGSASGFHVGFFVSLSATHIRILGGNQSNQVKYSNFPLSTYEIRGYRRPI
ncbi:MAG TPA: TIGR02594 family protein [Candidatus Competibacteraceae bacterium]|nr:TIGR02594 family protein [Candidatus Competibacteraceae bacterium]HQD56848.1 TIGR02594 family protein [Candidatus Competibacteraceae bacterium]